MKCRATVSFTGAITMSQNEVREVGDKIAKDLIRCGYLESIKTGGVNENSLLTTLEKKQEIETTDEKNIKVEAEQVE